MLLPVFTYTTLPSLPQYTRPKKVTTTTKSIQIPATLFCLHTTTPLLAAQDNNSSIAPKKSLRITSINTHVISPKQDAAVTMLSTTTRVRAPVASRQAAKLAKTVIISANSSSQQAGLHLRLAATPHCHACRSFSTTPATQLKDFFPAKDTHLIQTTPPAWPHPGYTMEEMKAVVPAHRKPRTFGDWVAWKTVRFARYWMDKATGMDREQQVDKANPTTAVEAEKPLTEAQWVSTAQHLCLRFSKH